MAEIECLASKNRDKNQSSKQNETQSSTFKASQQRRHAYDRSNYFSRRYCLYMFSFLWRFYGKEIEMDSFDQCSKKDECKSHADRLRK